MLSPTDTCFRYLSQTTIVPVVSPPVGPQCAAENDLYAELNQLIQSNDISNCIGCVISMGATLKQAAIDSERSCVSWSHPNWLATDSAYDKAGIAIHRASILVGSTCRNTVETIHLCRGLQCIGLTINTAYSDGLWGRGCIQCCSHLHKEYTTGLYKGKPSTPNFQAVDAPNANPSPTPLDIIKRTDKELAEAGSSLSEV